jgi:hypothetical protein
LAERNLSAMWRNYTSIGHSRLIYTNTASVKFIDELVSAMGDDPRVTAVLLTATDATARERLVGARSAVLSTGTSTGATKSQRSWMTSRLIG